jgi:hypothetical protein
VAIVLFAVGQLVLPPLAAHIVRGRLSPHGRVLSVSVSAFPAIELLFGDADRVDVHMASYSASESQLASRIEQSTGVSTLTVHVGEVNSGLVQVTSATLTKHGNEILAAGTITDANLRAAVPFLQSVTATGSSQGAVSLQGDAQIPFIGRVSAEAVLEARDGRVVVSGAGLLGSFLHLTVWSSPQVRVQSIAGRSLPGGLELSARAQLR